MRSVSYEDFIHSDQLILAVRVYRNRNNCTLREAKDAIDSLRATIAH